MKILYLFLLFIFFSTIECLSQNTATAVIYLNKIPSQGILLDSGWKFHEGDNADWAKQELNDSQWRSIQLSNYNTYLPELKSKNIGWFRLNLLMDSSLLKSQLAIQLSQLGASEIYLNGKLFQQFGSIKIPLNYKSFNPVNKPFLLPFNTGNSIVIAIRFASHVPSHTWLFTSANKLPLTVTINSWSNALLTYETNLEHARTPTKFSYLYLALALLFILLYAFFPREKVNLLFGALSFFAVTRAFLAFHLSQGSLDISKFALTSFFLNLNDMVEGILILSIICQAILQRITLYYWILFLSMCMEILIFLIFGHVYPQLILNFILHVLVTIAFFHLSILAFVKKNYIIGIVAFNCGLLNVSFFFFLSHISLEHLGIFSLEDYVLYAMTANFIMITIYVAVNFTRKSKNLEVQLVEIEKLSKDNLKKEQEKQELLASQNEMLEKQVTERTSALQQSFAELKSTQSQLIQSEKMASLGELTAGIAHEIQNPLNFVNNFSEVNTELIDEMEQEINKGNIEEIKAIANDIKENEQKINHHGKRADAIVKGMLQHSRTSSGIKEPTDINALVDEYLRLAYHGLRAKDQSFNATLKTDFDENVGNINIIPQDIGRVVLNLFTNAFYAVTEKNASTSSAGQQYEPTVSVSTRKINGKVEIKVKDNGNGIPQKVLDKIFQPFFTTKPTGQGTGLGLSMSYDIIKAHGGAINVETKEDEFSEFIINLPLREKEILK
jgi:two-component system NtrC family sensor kinase